MHDHRLPTPAPLQLARDVDLCLLKHSLVMGEEFCSAAELAPLLIARGHRVAVVRSCGGGTGPAAFRNLRHTHLVATAECQPSMVVDPHFSCQVRALRSRLRRLLSLCRGIVWPRRCASRLMLQFVTASPSPRFKTLHGALPHCFVGTWEQLQQLVVWVSREMEQSFRHQGQTLPPWREQGAILTKWRPRKQPMQTCVEGIPGSPGVVASPCGGCAYGAEPAGSVRCCCQQQAWSPASILVQETADAATASAPTTPTHHDHAVRVTSAQRRTSLLSQSLEAAGLRRASNPHPSSMGRAPAHSTGQDASSTQAGHASASSWVEPRIRVVRPGAQQQPSAAQPARVAV